MGEYMKNKNDWRKEITPDKVKIRCENNDRVLDADVISLNESTLIAALNGVKLTLVSKKRNGVYEGRMGGLDLVYVKNS